MSEPVTIYTVSRWPITAAAKTSAGYKTLHFEFMANSSSDALGKALEDCTWQNPGYNFGFRVISTRIVFSDGATPDLSRVGELLA
jgi:hypothetical protein